ncbi:FtsX-like permease family protein [Bacillus albus]|uniref:FtsX-like permease family protein n=1 Tax=Bacillus TaxID=1386 RepID=UPI00141A3A88|nr:MULTISPECIES: FtsX-like permease family protein [Bacillus]MBU5218522.1 FtsX-like permease family protein [Bacillus albus]MDA2027963.1 FtsX-like permease family protein [Bacillus cereus group sp. Bcc03]MDA2217892.1 FtsX-like permease family protein [Bacillus cereus group sp. Bc228]MDA2229464.1 FtsX-like permease family protein [Bacillus cereus group sp. Bc227]MDA2260814.1 FtsX-like permease family protein [Bacillus cereus group sp. Bc200]
MSLYSIALRNIKRNFKDYFIYFASMIFSIVIYFTFKSLQYNSQVGEAGDRVSNGFQLSSVMLIIFVAIFIIYSNGFFTRKRKKEIGLYSLLGIRKKEIGKMLFYENILMGLLSLVIGIVIGSLLSKVFLQLLVSMMELGVNVHFEVPIGAVIDTAVIFCFIILYTSFKGYRVIYRFKLIELFRADNEGEKMPKGSKIVAIISVLLMGIGYTLSITGLKHANHDNFMPLALSILLTTVLGTYLFFMFFTVFVLKRVRNKKSKFYNGMQIVTTSQLLYRIKGNAKSLATIAVLSAVTLTAVGTSVTTYYNVYMQAKKYKPISYSYKKTDAHVNRKVDEVLKEESAKNEVIHQYELETVKVIGEFGDDVSNKDALNSRTTELMAQSSFNKIAKYLNEETVDLKKTEAYAFDAMHGEGNKDTGVYKGKKGIFPIGEVEPIQVKEVKARNITNLYELVVVVPDEVYEQAKTTVGSHTVQNIDVKDERNSKVLTEKLKQVIPEEDAEGQGQFSDFYTIFREGIEMSGLIMFSGIFLGLVFLLASGSIIYFKQLTEAHADRERYIVLRKLGVTKKEMKKAIAKQMRFIFFIPLVVGILHTLFALKGLATVLPYEIAVPLLISIGVYSIIYIGYYFLTVRSYFRIVSK